MPRSASKPWNAIGRTVPVAGQRHDTSPFPLCSTLPPPSTASERRIGSAGSYPGAGFSSRHVSRVSTSGRTSYTSHSFFLSGPASSPRSAQKSAQRAASCGSSPNSPSTPADSAGCSEADALVTSNHTGISCSTSAIRCRP